jgi:hypothetical protein
VAGGMSRAAARSRKRIAGEKRSKKRYVFAAVGKLSARKFLINWGARRDSFGAARLVPAGPPSLALRCPTQPKRRVVELGLFISGVRTGDERLAEVICGLLDP